MNPFAACLPKRVKPKEPTVNPQDVVQSIQSVLEKAAADAAKVRELTKERKAMQKKIAALTKQLDAAKAAKSEALKSCAKYQETIANLRDQARPLQIEYKRGTSAWPTAGECRPWAEAVAGR